MKPGLEIGLLLLFLLTFIQPLLSQSKLSISYQDSLIASANSPFASNLLKLTNKQEQPLNITVAVTTPDGWQVLGSSETIVSINANEELALPITLRKQPKATANWLPVTIALKAANSSFDSTLHFYIRAEPVYKAQIAVKQAEYDINDPKQLILIDLNVKNTGNAKDDYSIVIKNDFLDFRKTYTVALKAQETAPLRQEIRIPKDKWAQFKGETINIYLNSENGVFSPSSVNIQKLANSVKENKSAYETTQMHTETGLMVNGKYATYYGSVAGDFKLEGANIQYSYRTKQYGSNNNLYSNIFSLKVTKGPWKADLGQLSENRFFYGMGNGINIERHIKEGTRFYFSGIIGDKRMLYAGDLVQAGISYSFKKIGINQDLAFNSLKNTKSYLFNNHISLLRTNHFTAEARLGLGFDQSHFSDEIKLGTGLGYKMKYSNKGLTLESRMSENNQSFPGMNRGAKDNLHSIGFTIKKLRTGLFYSETSQPLNLFRDTLFNGDLLANNSKRYGASLSISGKLGNFSVAAGKISGTVLSSGLANYNYIEPGASITFFNKVNLSANSTIGYNSSIKYKNSATVFNSSNLRLSSKWGGINLLMVSIPHVIDSLATTNHYVKTHNLSPYVQFKLFKSFNLNLSYNWSKTLIDDRKTSALNSNLTYYNYKKNIDLTFSGMVPLAASKANTLGMNSAYYSLTVRKTFTVPLIFLKKHYKLRMRFFEDGNYNQKREATESTFDSLKIQLNNIYFLTDNKGEIEYRNIKKGDYQVDITKTPKGYVPTNGVVQKVSVSRDQVIEIPLVRSKVISGKISLEMDSLSNIRFSVSGLKVTATDTLGNVFQALANEKGDYYINVPSGFYKVSLNPDAFDKSFKPDIMFFMKTVMKDEEVNFYVRQQKRKVRVLNSN